MDRWKIYLLAIIPLVVIVGMPLALYEKPMEDTYLEPEEEVIRYENYSIPLPKYSVGDKVVFFDGESFAIRHVDELVSFPTEEDPNKFYWTYMVNICLADDSVMYLKDDEIVAQLN